MKKLIVPLLIIIILLSTLIPNVSIAADEDDEKDEKTTAGDIINSETQEDNYNSIVNEGKANVNSSEGTWKQTIPTLPSSSSLIASILSVVITAIFAVLSLLLSLVSGGSTNSVQLFTIGDLVFNKLEFFNANFLLNTGVTNEINVDISQNVANWYVAARSIAIIASLAVLVYIGIRMAIASVATDKAKYKNMIVSW
ncbi:MAG: hypothetical protein LBL91_03070, partial [Lachnospiraceae bacterium]|nr:hypothetical protein [Lachnospiraceae bacterium]